MILRNTKVREKLKQARPLHLLAFIFIFVFLIIAAVELVTFNSFRHTMTDSVAERALDQAELVAQNFKISYAALEDIKKAAPDKAPGLTDSLRFKEQVKSISQLKDTKYVYIVSRIPSSEVKFYYNDPKLAKDAGYPIGTPMNFMYLLNSEDETGNTEMDRYDADFIKERYNEQQPFYIVGDDLRWNTAITGLYPYTTTDGVFAGYVGVDIGIEAYYGMLSTLNTTFWIMFGVIVVMLVLLFAILLTRMRYNLYKDNLTGFLNRNVYQKTVEKRLNFAKEGLSAFYFIDIDGFKSVNDTMGHMAGDQLLMLFAKKLQVLAGRKTVLIRIAGDEFGVLKQGFKDENEAGEYGNSLVSGLSKDLWNVNGIPLRIGVSAGGAIWGKPAKSITELLEYADFAMYTAKTDGKNRLSMFDYDHYNLVEREQRLYKEIAGIILEKRYTHVFQPIVDLKSGQVAGYEGLTRFKTEEDKQNVVSTYLNAIGKGALLERILSESVAVAFKDMKGNRSVFLSVNEGIEDLYEGLSHEELKRCQSVYAGLNMVIEVNDPQFTDVGSVINKATGVRSMGQRIAIDNFVTGTRSASMLVGMNPEFIKLSPSLVRDIEKSPQIRRFVSMTVRFAHKINSQVIAVGVETKKTVSILKHLDVDFVQGFLIGKPSETLNDIEEDIRELILKDE